MFTRTKCLKDTTYEVLYTITSSAVEGRTGFQGGEKEGPSGAENFWAMAFSSWTTGHPLYCTGKTLLLTGNTRLYIVENITFGVKSFYLVCTDKV